MAADSTFWFKTDWRNTGVAPCLPGGHPSLTIKDAKGGIVSVFVDEGMDMRDLRVAEPGQAPVEGHKAEFGLPLASDERTRPLKPGEYDVFVSVGTSTGTPRIALPLADDDGHHRYRIGKLTVLDKSGS